MVINIGEFVEQKGDYMHRIHSKTEHIGCESMSNRIAHYHLKESDDKDIAFAVSCLFCQCLTLDEFKVWLENIIRESDVDDIPPYIFDLIDFDGYLADIFDIIGFEPIWPFDDKAENALYGISYKRDMVIIEDFALSRKESEELLNKYPEIGVYFRKLFDFISW